MDKVFHPDNPYQAVMLFQCYYRWVKEEDLFKVRVCVKALVTAFATVELEIS